jgi:hypothetical protein
VKGRARQLRRQNSRAADSSKREKVEDIAHGDIMLSHYKGDAVVRMTPKLVDTLRRASISLLEKLREELAGRLAPATSTAVKGAQRVDPEQAKIEALRRDIENDDFWITLVDGVVLNAPGSHLDKGNACRFVRGSEWQSPNKPRVVLEILEKATPALGDQDPVAPTNTI